jgi:hypothetical protein
MSYDITRNFDSFSYNSPVGPKVRLLKTCRNRIFASQIWPGCSLTRLYNYNEHVVYHTTPPTRAVVMAAVSLVLTIDILVLVSSIAAFLAIRDYQKRQGLPYPPGPRPLPLIGNLFDVPKEFSWLTYARLSKKYGKDYLR